MSVLPGPVVLRDDAPLPDGWRWSDLAWRDPATVEVVRERLAPIEGLPDPCLDCGEVVCECAPAPTRAERIEAAARAYLAAEDAYLAAATYDDEADLDAASAAHADARAALLAALCACTGHGPDLACAEHGEGLRKWQARNAP